LSAWVTCVVFFLALNSRIQSQSHIAYTPCATLKLKPTYAKTIKGKLRVYTE